MKILIVMPNQSRLWFDAGIGYSAGTAYVSAYLKQQGHNIDCLNLYWHRDAPISEVVGQLVKSNDYDVVMTGGLIGNLPVSKEIINAAKEYKPGITAIIGGGLVTFSPSEAMTIIDNADFGVIGEGELTSNELLLALQGGGKQAVDGIIYRDAYGALVQTKERESIPNLDGLPFPDYEGFRIFEIMHLYKSAAIVSARSCPFGCTYCAHSGGKKYRQRSLDNIFSELDWILSNAEITHFTFIDELFASNADRFMEFVDRIAPYNLTWHLSIRADTNIPLDVLIAARKAGCTFLQMGLESGCDKILKSMRKRTNLQMLESEYKKIYESGIRVTSALIFGDTEETMGTVEESIDYGKHLIRNYGVPLGLNTIRLYPGSPLYDKAVSDKVIADPLDFIRNSKEPISVIPPVNVSKMSDGEYHFLVNRLLETEVRNFELIMRTRCMQPASKGENFISYSNIIITNINYKFSAYVGEFTCPACGHREPAILDAKTMAYNINWEYHNLKPYDYCGSCIRTYQGNNRIYLYLELTEPFWTAIEKSLAKLLSNGAIAIWPMSCFFTKYRREFAKMEKHLNCADQLIYVDSDPKLVDIAEVNGHIIRSPLDSLRSVGCIVCPSDYFSEIADQVKETHPNLKVYSLFELPFEDCGTL